MLPHRLVCVVSSHTHYSLVWVDGRRRDSGRRRENREVSRTVRRRQTHVDQQLPGGITSTLIRRNNADTPVDMQ